MSQKRLSANYLRKNMGISKKEDFRYTVDENSFDYNVLRNGFNL